ncbi:MAG: NAD(P)/FAD-dependent oxidoreductase [Maricaulaceae bacterium]
MKSPHIIIIGAGLIGLSTADSLIRGGVQVTVIDAAKAPMRGASFSNSSMLHPSQAMPWDFAGARAEAIEKAKAVFAMGQRSVELTIARARDLGLDMHRRAVGTWQLFDDQAALVAAQDVYQEIGVLCEMAATPKGMAPLPALFFPEDKSGNAYDYGMALSQDLVARGVVFMLGQEAKPHAQSGRIIGIDIGGEIIMADHVVLAAGYSSESLAADCGVKLPMRGEAGYALNFRRPENLAQPDTPIMHAPSRSAMTVFDDVVRLSGTTGRDNADSLLRHWTQIAPDIMQALGDPIGPEWRGIRPMSQAGHPYIGKTVVDGLWVNTGHGHMGWTLCAGSGELLADMILNRAEAPQFKLPT